MTSPETRGMQFARALVEAMASAWTTRHGQQTTVEPTEPAARAGLDEVSAAVRERGAAAGFVRDRVWSTDVAPGVRAGGAFAAAGASAGR